MPFVGSLLFIDWVEVIEVFSFASYRAPLHSCEALPVRGQNVFAVSSTIVIWDLVQNTWYCTQVRFGGASCSDLRWCWSWLLELAPWPLHLVLAVVVTGSNLRWWCFSLRHAQKDSTCTCGGFTHCNLRWWCFVKCKFATMQEYCTVLNYCKNYCMNNFSDSLFLQITTLILSRETD